jgi:hypothetical protein
MDPENVAVKVHIRKEHIVLAALEAILRQRGRGDLLEKVTHDCVQGPSKRRMDWGNIVSERLTQDVEVDEDQHVNRDTSCEHAKLMGHMMDRGALGFTAEEDALWREGAPSDETLEELKETLRDTPEMHRLRAARRRATLRVVRDYNARHRAATKSAAESGSAVCIAPKLLVIRFNCDQFVAADGTRVGSLFTATGVQDADMKYKPSKRFNAAMEALATAVLERVDAEKDDAWFASLRELEIVYVRYDGCDPDGVDRRGEVAAAHAARARENAKRQRLEVAGAGA